MDIFEACEQGDLEKVKKMVTKTPSLVFMKEDRYGWTPLHYASRDGHLAIVEFLVYKGAVVKAMEYLGFTPLLLACSSGKLTVVKFLVWKEGDVNVKDQQKEDTPLYFACITGHLDIIKYLEKEPVRIVFITLCHSRVFSHDLVRSLFTYFL
jgi:ankyrin repeat protein